MDTLDVVVLTGGFGIKFTLVGQLRATDVRREAATLPQVEADSSLVHRGTRERGRYCMPCWPPGSASFLRGPPN